MVKRKKNFRLQFLELEAKAAKKIGGARTKRAKAQALKEKKKLQQEIRVFEAKQKIKRLGSTNLTPQEKAFLQAREARKREQRAKFIRGVKTTGRGLSSAATGFGKALDLLGGTPTKKRRKVKRKRKR